MGKTWLALDISGNNTQLRLLTKNLFSQNRAESVYSFLNVQYFLALFMMRTFPCLLLLSLCLFVSCEVSQEEVLPENNET